MSKNYLCYVDNKTMIHVPDDVFALFLFHLDNEHPEYLVMQDITDFFFIKMYFLDDKLVAFTISTLDE